MMRVVYIVMIAIVFGRLAMFSLDGDSMEQGIAERIVEEAHVPNSVAGILLRNRLYDTALEVIVFTLAVLGVQYAFSLHSTEKNVAYLQDATLVILARIAAIVSALIFLELAVRGHLAPGGGFAAGVAGGSSIGLVAITYNIHDMYGFYQRWHIASLEKIAVLLVIFIAAACLVFPSVQFAGQPLSTLTIPLLNLLIAGKVAIGSWAVVLLFIRHRGLL